MVVFLCPQQKQRNKVVLIKMHFSEMVSILRQTAQGLFLLQSCPRNVIQGLQKLHTKCWLDIEVTVNENIFGT